MANQINLYSVILDAEKTRWTDNEFVEQIMRGFVDERGYCPCDLDSTKEDKECTDDNFVNQPITLECWEKIPSRGGRSGWNTQFEILRYQKTDGVSDSMVVHGKFFREHRKIEGLDGLLIDDAILIKTG